MERRASTASESSLEPAEVSSSNKTLSSEANSSLALKTSHDSDNIESDENEDFLNNNTCKNRKNETSADKKNLSQDKEVIVRRDNLRQLMDKMLQKKMASKNNNSSSEENLNGGQEPNENNESEASKDETKYVCPICEAVSSTQHDFTNHIRNHNNNRESSDDGTSFTCRICSKVLSSASSLDRHVLVHTGERPFNCKFCNLTFTTNGNMHRHMRTHKQQQQNERESYESDGSSDSSRSSHGGGGRNMIKANNFSHKRKASEEEFSNRQKIRAVNHNNNDIMSPNGLQNFCCPVCIRNDFANMISLENHMDKEHPTIPAKCRHCEMVFKSHKALNAHRCGSNKAINVQQGFKDINFVDFTSDKFPIIAKSLCEQGIRTPITNQKYECPLCYRAFPCASAVEIHIKDCRGDSARDFSSKRRRTQSESSVEDEKGGDDFFANLALQNRSIPTSATSTPSSNADKSFNSMSMMIKQELRATPPYYQYLREGGDFADIDSMIRATASGGLEKPMSEQENKLYNEEEENQEFTCEFRKMKLRGEFPCRLCTMVFPNLRALKGHNRIHLSAAGPGPYRCNMCPHSINDKAALIRHMRSHNGDRPYECALCNYAFTTKANCERHLRNRHGKTTRDEVKRAIIYHPSEDSSVEDHSKKIALYNSTSQRYQNEDDGLSGRSTPVSHLKEMLHQDDAQSRIQVKSLDKLKSRRNFDSDIEEEMNDSHRPMDMTMDALDLSKKTDSFTNNGHEASDEEEDDENNDMDQPEIPKFDLGMFEKNMLMQQQLLSEVLSNSDPAQMLARMYGAFGFPTPGFPIHPAMLLQNPLLMNDAMKNFFPKDMLPPTPPQTNVSQSQVTPSMSGGSLIVNPFASPDSSPTGPPSQITRNMDQSPVRASIPIPPFPPTPQESPKKTSTPNIPSQSNNGPVKMVIKNGVLMPKQKQRRYRTERPFACEHCSARFTLRSNMERHIKQQHPQFWAQRQRGNHGLMRRGPPTQMSLNGASMMPTLQASGFGGISEHVKHAILQQHLKSSRESPKSMMNSPSYPYGMPLPLQTQLTEFPEKSHTPGTNADDDEENDLIIDEDFHAEDLSKSSDGHEKHLAARKVAENILEEAMKLGGSHAKAIELSQLKEAAAKKFENDSENDKESDREQKRETKEETNDLVSVSKLVDNATNSMMFSKYFR